MTELEIYEEYCKRHPEEITSDFMLEEDGNEDYINEIEFDMLKALNENLEDDVEMG